MSQLPNKMEHTQGAVYVVTHAREFNLEQWTAAAISCLMGEHGGEAREMILIIAQKRGLTINVEGEGK